MTITNTIDRILVEQKAKGKNYADWQKERYPVETSHHESKGSVTFFTDGERRRNESNRND